MALRSVVFCAASALAVSPAFQAGLEIGTQIEVPNYGRAVVLDFKRAHFRVQYTSGTQRSLKRAEFLRYYAASLE